MTARAEHLELLLDSFNVLERVYEDTIDVDQKNILKLLGKAFLDAISKGAVYHTERDATYLSQYVEDADQWLSLREKIREKHASVFFHGDGGAENAVILLSTSVYPEVTTDILFVSVLLPTQIISAAIMSNRGSDLVNAWPMMVLHRSEVGGAGLMGWALSGQERPDEEWAGTYINVYRGALCYLNDQLANGIRTDTYGDGLHNSVILSPEFMITPAWLQ